MKSLNPSRRRWSVATALGVCLTVLAGSGLLAAVRDTAQSNDNYITSGTFTGIADLLIAKVSASPQQGQYCSNATYIPGPEAAVYIRSLNLDTAEMDGPFQYLCVKSRRFVEGQRLFVGYRNLRDTEHDCTTSPKDESAGDPTCGEGGTGELSPIVMTAIAAGDGTTGAECGRTPARRLNEWASSSSPTPADFLCDLQPDKPLLVTVLANLDRNSQSDQRQRAQTDVAMWDLVFELHID